MIIECYDAGHIVGSLYQPSQLLVLAHGEDTIVGSLQCLNQACAGFQRNNFLGLGTFHIELHGLLCYMIFFSYLACEYVPISADILFLVGWYAKQGHTVARNGVVKLTGIVVGQSQAIALLCLIEEAGKYFQGVGAFLVNVIARVAANEALQRNFQEEQALGGVFFLKTEGSGRVATSSARDKYLPLVLRVKVDKHVACHESGLHALGTRESSLLIAREYTLQWSVLYIIGVENCQFDGTSDAVVSSQCCTFSLKPLAVYIGLYGIFVEVELNVDQLLANHVHVALQNDGFAVLHSWCGALADDDVARFVDYGLKVMAFPPIS